MSLFLLAVLCSAAQAENPTLQGGSAFLAKVGPWHISKSSYSDGAQVCWAYNFPGQRNFPAFAYNKAVKDNKLLVNRYRFSADRKAANGERVTLRIGAKTFYLIHRNEMPENVFSVLSATDRDGISAALDAVAASAQKNFFIEEGQGRRHKLRADSAKQMRELVDRHCPDA